MGIREMSLSAVKQVSGAGLLASNGDLFEAVCAAGLIKFKEEATRLDSSQRWQYVTVTHDAIRERFVAFVDSLEGNGTGQDAVATWIQRYAS